MLYRALTDFVVLFHFAFIVFVLFGGLLACKWRRLVWVHIPSSVWGMLNEFFGWWCPLTPLENWLREQSGGVRYHVGFVEHYIMPIVYPVDLTRELQIVLASAVLVINGVIYGFLYQRALKAERRRATR
jgi:hypothetical protein